MNVSEYTEKNIILASWTNLRPNAPHETQTQSSPIQKPQTPKMDWLQPLRRWIDGIEIRDRALAHQLCRLIPAQCPFEREIKLLGRTLFQIPPLCKLNPLYEEVVALRFRALCFLADQCQEDISQYC